MKTFIFLLFPIILQGQEYRLDSVRVTTPTWWEISRYTYENEKDFQRHYEWHDEEGFDHGDIIQYIDSLPVNVTFFNTEGYSSFEEKTYDDLRRLTSEATYINDSLRYSQSYKYHLNTDLISLKESVNLRAGDTIDHTFEEFSYDSLLRTIYHRSILTSVDTHFAFRLAESWTNFVGDSVSYSMFRYSEEEGVFDTSYSKKVFMPDQYYGDTLRTWTKYYWITKDTLILNSDELVNFQWGSFDKYEDAGDWSYWHGTIFGYYTEYEPIAGGYSFIFYESGWPQGNPANWKTDIEKYNSISFIGTILLNPAGLPLIKELNWNGGSTNTTEYFYSLINHTIDPGTLETTAGVCRVINDLDANCIYYNMAGHQVKYPYSPSLLIECCKNKNSRVFFIQD